MTPDLERMLGGDALGDAPARLRAAVQPRRVVPGWGTVELDRAEIEVAAALSAAGGRVPARAEAGDDEVLGSRCRALRAAGDLEVLLLEPSTEGLLAAALARHGEGTLALYLLVGADAPERARRAGFALSSPRGGPLGPERLVLGGPRWGPFLLVVPE